jgi:hypothetical protein
MEKDKIILPILTLLLFMGVGSCTVQKHVVDYSFTFLDKWGMVIGYEIQYVPESRTPLEDGQKEKLFVETKKIASAYGREIRLTDFYFKRDSIEKQFINDIIEQMKKNQLEITEIHIVNLTVPKQIADALAQRAKISKEPQPTRVKVIDR